VHATGLLKFKAILAALSGIVFSLSERVTLLEHYGLPSGVCIECRY
jgi:hypothetical protein